MKIALRLMLAMAIMATGFNVQAQRKQTQEKKATPEFPISEKTGKVHYSEVTKVEGTQAELYTRVEAWFNSNYKNPGDVIKERNPEDGTIMGKHRFYTKTVNPKTGVESKGPMVLYTIRVIVKDGRYKVVVTDIKEKGTTNIPLKDVLDKHGASYTDAKAGHLIQVDEYITKLIAELNKAMQPAKPNKEEDW